MMAKDLTTVEKRPKVLKILGRIRRVVETDERTYRWAPNG